MTASATADVHKFFQAHSIFCKQKKYCVIEKCVGPYGIFTWLTHYNIFALRISILNVSKTPASARNSANTLRLCRHSGHLFTQPPEQFQSEIALEKQSLFFFSGGIFSGMLFALLFTGTDTLAATRKIPCVSQHFIYPATGRFPATHAMCVRGFSPLLSISGAAQSHPRIPESQSVRVRGTHSVKTLPSPSF
ncbi:MAG: hypothetical protein RBR41_08880 [Desulfovibrio sp.]|uniref:hypothetical protein n=1 Tax=Desulfovibrio sp. TaxID=885 RepID=UPI002A36CBEB|nr:hypothetical protein [Desulfovibrio sp.]MDY0259761.1 hypothetical protein [Desulfovibrio sp.]